MIGELLTKHIALQKKTGGERLKVQWVSPSVCDQIIDFISHWKRSSVLWDNWFCRVFGLLQEKLIVRRKWYGLPNQHNGAMPKDSCYMQNRNRQIIFSFLLTKDMVIGAMPILWWTKFKLVDIGLFKIALPTNLGYRNGVVGVRFAQSLVNWWK